MTEQLPLYRCHKTVRAVKIADVVYDAPIGADDSEWPAATIYPEGGTLDGFRVTSDYTTRHRPQPGGYFVEYSDGYCSFSPAEAFKQGYRPLTGMSFGEAIEALKAGQRVARTGWNGKGMWLRYFNPYCDREFGIIEKCQDVLDSGTPLPWIGMKTADNKFVPWLASQTDMLADDWQIIEGAAQ